MEFPALFQKETRCDFAITEMMKRAWVVQITQNIEMCVDGAAKVKQDNFLSWQIYYFLL